MEKTLQYIGTDSWDRAVYKDENGKLWKDVNCQEPGQGVPNLHSSCGNTFDGEPDMPLRGDYRLIRTPKQIAEDIYAGDTAAKQELEKMMGKDLQSMTPAERRLGVTSLSAFESAWNPTPMTYDELNYAEGRCINDCTD